MPWQLAFNFDPPPPRRSREPLPARTLPLLLNVFRARFNVAIETQDRGDALELLGKLISELEEWRNCLSEFHAKVTKDSKEAARKRRERAAA